MKILETCSICTLPLIGGLPKGVIFLVLFTISNFVFQGSWYFDNLIWYFEFLDAEPKKNYKINKNKNFLERINMYLTCIYAYIYKGVHDC